jgi:hypothetical protein
MKGKYKFRINTKERDFLEWNDRWKKIKGRWKIDIEIFEDLEEDLMAYLIIKDNPKEGSKGREFNWEQFRSSIYRKKNFEFIDNSLQDLTKFLVLKNGYDETPIIISKKIFDLPK